MNSSAIIISNPAARRASGRKVERACAVLRSRGFDTEVITTQKRGHAIELAREVLPSNPSLIVAAGGDGTINEVINGMVRSGVPLAILPLGTTNVLAREIGVPEEPSAAMTIAASRSPRTVSLGRIKTEGPHGADRYFCLMAGIGFDGMAVKGMNALVKKSSGKAAYILSGFRTFLGYDPQPLVFNVDGIEYRGYSAVIGNAGRYGGDFKVTPDANLLEPVLYACIFGGSRRRDLLKYVFGVVTGRHLNYGDVVYEMCTEISVTGTAHIQIDGDYLGPSPARVSVEKDALLLVY